MTKYPQEITKYPQEQTILYKEEKHKFNYTILQEGVYPSESYLKYTSSHHYKIPDNYEVKTTWGKKTVKCSINYINNKPVFCVYFGQNFENQVVSDKTATNAATANVSFLYHQVLFSYTIKNMQPYASLCTLFLHLSYTIRYEMRFLFLFSFSQTFINNKNLFYKKLY